MLILEVADMSGDAGVDTGKLLAMTKFLIGRAKDTGSDAKISLQAFLSLANSLNIGVTKESLQKIISADNQDENAVILRNYIANVTPTEVIFKGSKNTAGNLGQPQNPEQARKVVDQMAKRALK